MSTKILLKMFKNYVQNKVFQNNAVQNLVVQNNVNRNVVQKPHLEVEVVGDFRTSKRFLWTIVRSCLGLWILKRVTRILLGD